MSLALIVAKQKQLIDKALKRKKEQESNGFGRKEAIAAHRRATTSSDSKHKHLEMILDLLDPTLDFRALGKSSKCNLDHSRYHCILPYTSKKQPPLKLNYVRVVQCDSEEKFQIDLNEKLSQSVISTATGGDNYKAVRPLYK